MGSLRDREVACSASDRQGSNFESCVWRTVSSHSSHHRQEVLQAQLSLYVHKGDLKPDSVHFISATTKVLFTTNNLMSAHKSDLGHKRLILSTKEVITFTSQVISSDTKVILAYMYVIYFEICNIQRMLHFRYYMMRFIYILLYPRALSLDLYILPYILLPSVTSSRRMM